MKIGYIVQPNKKGQIVIPKNMRDELEIDDNVPLNAVIRGSGIFLEPIDSFVPKKNSGNIHIEVLKRTAGSWAGDSWKKTESKRRKVELTATKRRKKTW